MEENNEEYDSLYSKGFDEGIIELEPDEELEEVSEPEEQPSKDITDEETEVTEPDEEDDEVVEDVEPKDSDEPELFEIKHNGQILKLTKDEMILMANKGFDYTSKTQDLSSKRRQLDIIEGIDNDTLQTFKDAKEGNKEAVAKLVKDFGIDPYDLDGEVNYKPVVEEKNYELDDVIDTINKDAENATILNGWVSSLPSQAQTFLASNPNILNDLYVGTTNGTAKKVMPEVLKHLAINPSLDFKSTYNSVYSSLQSVSEEKEQVTEAKPQASRESKKKATITKSKVNSKTNDHKDIWDDDELYKQMQEMRKR